jgi:hypothetical protein
MKRSFWGGGLAVFLLLPPAIANAALIWDGNTSTTGVQDTGGTWINGGNNWWNGNANVAWDNANPTVAQFGNANSTSAYDITVNGTVKATGLTCNKATNFLPDATNGGTIEMNGATFTVPTYQTLKFYTPLTTAAGVEKIVLKGNSTQSAKYLYLYNANDFDAAIEIGGATANEACAVFVSAGTPLTTPVVLPGTTAGLGGDATKSITVLSGSTLGIRSNTITDKPIVLKGGTGFGGRGNLEFYSPAWNCDLQGSVTMEADTTICTRANGKISGSLTGDFNLAISSSASNTPGAVTFTNAVNSSNSLTVSSQTQATIATGHFILAGNYTADEHVTLNKYGEATIRSGATLTSPVVNVNNGGALRGVGSVDADVIVAVGGTIEAGEEDIINAVPDPDVYYLDVASTIGTLSVAGNVTVAGTFDVEYDSTARAADRLDVSGTLDLTGATLKLTDVGSSMLNGGPYVLASYGTLVGTPTLSGVVPEGYQLVFDYQGNKIALVPEPAAIALLLSLALAVAGSRRRPNA